eukprot:9499183-Lingulodinium_polyedra.AAC.1
MKACAQVPSGCSGEKARTSAGLPIPSLATAGHGPLSLLGRAAQASSSGDAPPVAALDWHQLAVGAR